MIKNKIKTFEDLIVWQKASMIWLMICQDVKSFPSNRISWIITDQVIRSIGSISANIAEGFGSGYPKEFIHSLRIARKESIESINWLIKLEQLKYIPDKRFSEYKLLVDEIIKMINSLIGKIQKKQTKKTKKVK